MQGVQPNRDFSKKVENIGGRRESALWPYGLREEARKSWDYVVSNEVVYFAEAREWNSKGAVYTPEEYAKGGFWVELHLSFGGERHVHETLIYEAMKLGVEHCFRRNAPLKLRKADWYYTMLDGVTKFVEEPQEVVFVGVPSVVRLKLSNDVECFCRNTLCNVREPLSDFGGKVPKNREARIIRGTVSSEGCQLPSQVVQRETETANSLSCKDTKTERRVLYLKPDDIALFPNVLLAGNAVCFEPVKSAQFAIESCEMFLRPFGEQIKVVYVERHVSN